MVMAAWKKKEKPLSPEEAIALAKKELAPFWFNSEPFLASFKTETGKTETGASILPLNSEFSKQAWLFFFLDPAEYSGESAFSFVREWYRRYHLHKLGFVVFLKPSPVGMMGGQELVKKFQLQNPIVVDQESLFAQALGVNAYPAFVVINGSTEVVRGQGIKAIVEDHLEEKVQVFLRQADPGLALPLSFQHQGTLETGRVDFGTQMKPSSQVRLAGTWTQGDDFIRTQDPGATLEVSGNGSCISVVARSGLDTQPSAVQINPMEGSFSHDLLGEGTTLIEGGTASARVQSVALYHLLKGLPAGRRKVRLSFPDADRIPVIIYGLRFGD
jgi:hypothetical protein